MKSGLRVSVLAFSALFSGLSSVQSYAVTGPTWATVGAGCVPVGQTTQGGLHFNTAGRAKFNTGKTGEIILTCPIAAPINGAMVFTLSYLDPDGPNSNARVTATLRRLNRRTGAVSTVDVIDSNAEAATTYRMVSKNLGVDCVGYSFENVTYDYYVQINLTRTSTLYQPEFGAVSLGDVIC